MVREENNPGFNAFMDKMNANLKSLVVDSAASVNQSINLQYKIDLLEFRIKHEKNIVKKRELEKQLQELKMNGE